MKVLLACGSCLAVDVSRSTIVYVYITLFAHSSVGGGSSGLPRYCTHVHVMVDLSIKQILCDITPGSVCEPV